MMKMYVLMKSWRDYDEGADTPLLASANEEYVNALCKRLSAIKTVTKMRRVFPDGPSRKHDLDCTTFEVVEVPSELVLGGPVPRQRPLTPAQDELIEAMKKGVVVHFIDGLNPHFFRNDTHKSITPTVHSLIDRGLIKKKSDTPSGGSVWGLA